MDAGTTDAVTRHALSLALARRPSFLPLRSRVPPSPRAALTPHVPSAPTAEMCRISASARTATPHTVRSGTAEAALPRSCAAGCSPGHDRWLRQPSASSFRPLSLPPSPSADCLSDASLAVPSPWLRCAIAQEMLPPRLRPRARTRADEEAERRGLRRRRVGSDEAHLALCLDRLVLSSFAPFSSIAVASSSRFSSRTTRAPSMSGIIRRIIQSVKLARMGLRINRAEAQRATKLQAASASRLQAAQRAGGSGASAAPLTPEQMAARIAELRASLAASQSQAWAAPVTPSAGSAAASMEALLQRASSSPSPQQMQDEMTANIVEGAGSSAAAAAGSATASSAPATPAEDPADVHAAAQLAAFTARLDALSALRSEEYAASMAQRSIQAIHAAEAFGAEAGAAFGSAPTATKPETPAADERTGQESKR